MPCESVRQPNQTLAQRVTEIKRIIDELNLLIMKKRVNVVVGKQGAIAFVGSEWERIRNGVTDACAYRTLLTRGSMLTRTQIMRAEELAGTKVNRQVVAQGVHSHDGGATWHGKG
jgi:hypothetical protein